MAQTKQGQEVTEGTWLLVDAAITSFQKLHPVAWKQWKTDIAKNRGEYNDAKEGDLKKSSFRNVLSFPVVLINGAPYHSLKSDLDRIIPGFTAPDEPGKKNHLFHQFVRKYPVFIPGEKY